MTAIEQYLEACKRNATPEEIFIAACEAADEVRELHSLCRELFVTGAKPLTKQRERELKDRIRELVR